MHARILDQRHDGGARVVAWVGWVCLTIVVACLGFCETICKAPDVFGSTPKHIGSILCEIGTFPMSLGEFRILIEIIEPMHFESRHMPSESYVRRQDQVQI